MGKFLKEGVNSYLNRALNLKLVPLVVPHFSHREKIIKNNALQGIKDAFSSFYQEQLLFLKEERPFLLWYHS